MLPAVRSVPDRSVPAPPTNHQPRAGPGAGAAPSPKRLARIAGVLYLLVAVFGGFAQGFVEPTMYVAGDAAATAGNVVANAGLVRQGVVAELVGQTFFVFLALTLYALLAHVHRSAARAMLVLVALAAGIVCLTAVFEFAGLRVATGAEGGQVDGAAGSDAVVLLLLDTQHDGVLVAQIFFGRWLVPLGYLAHTSGWFPTALSVLLVAAGASSVVDLLAAFLVPDVAQTIHPFVVIPVVAVAEIWMVLYLLEIGVRSVRPVSLSAEALSSRPA